ncbi:Trafficking protein particle complex subunit 33, partial [Boothiomyces sp. JEL0838]
MQSQKEGKIAEASFDYLLMEISKSNYESLDQMGFRIGYSIVEKMTKDKPRMVDILDKVKFICKDFWMGVFQKQVDNLKANHSRGIYVLTDNSFRIISKLSSDSISGEQATLFYSQYLALPCGIIRGALYNLGLPCSVMAEVTSCPS